MIDTKKKEARVFDFDDTLVKTSSKTHVYRNGEFITSLTPSQYHKYTKQKNDVFDLSEFDNPTNLSSAKLYVMWDLFVESIHDPNIDVYILTARHKEAKRSIQYFLLSKNIDLSLDSIFAIGDNAGDTNIPLEKRRVLEKICEIHSFIDFYDDNEATIEFVKDIKNLNVYLVE